MSISSINAKGFYKEALGGGIVYTVKDTDGYPAPKDSANRRVMPFWSLRSRVEKIIERVPAYKNFSVAEIPLEDFIRKWLPGLAKDGLLVGLNWSGDRATGYDVPAQEVIRTLENGA